VELHLPGWGFLVSYQCVQGLFCECRKAFDARYYRDEGHEQRAAEYTDLLSVFMWDFGLPRPGQERRSKATKLPDLLLPVGADQKQADRVLDVFEYLVVRFANQRLGVVRSCTRPGSARLTQDKDFSRVRVNEWHWLFDRGSLLTWSLVVRRSLGPGDCQKGWARGFDRSWGSKSADLSAPLPFLRGGMEPDPPRFGGVLQLARLAFRPQESWLVGIRVASRLGGSLCGNTVPLALWARLRLASLSACFCLQV
jgi:hypothetical protein